MSSPFRFRPPHDPVTLTLDGEGVVADRGEPIAAALLAKGFFTVARSPKYHRPRGPSCLRGACDGCLARVDEIPNVMTCMTPATDGAAVVTQNRLGPRDADLLRMADWFFPEGMNHHELLAGVPGIGAVMQKFARRVAGLGKLPEASSPRRGAKRREVDVFVVGGGVSGMAVAAELAARGRTVELVDDQLDIGGSAAALAGPDLAAFGKIRDRFAAARVTVRRRTTAAGIYGRDLLVASEEGVEIVSARALVFACGAHDGVLAFEGNDVPGVLSARAGGWLLARGIVLGDRICVVVPEGGGPFGASFARGVELAKREIAAVGRRVRVDVVHGEPIAVSGTNVVRGLRVRTTDGEREVEADAVLVDAPRAPAYELAAQAGAKVLHQARGFVVLTEGGLVTGGVYAVGEMAGVPLDAEAIADDARDVAAAIAST